MDSIRICELSLSTRIGVMPEERASEQKIMVDIDITVDTATAGTSDELSDTIDYMRVVELMQELARTERNTVERFAHDAAQALLQTFSIESVTLSVWKHVVPTAKKVGVTITRP